MWIPKRLRKPFGKDFTAEDSLVKSLTKEPDWRVGGKQSQGLFKFKIPFSYRFPIE